MQTVTRPCVSTSDTVLRLVLFPSHVCRCLILALIWTIAIASELPFLFHSPQFETVSHVWSDGLWISHIMSLSLFRLCYSFLGTQSQFMHIPHGCPQGHSWCWLCVALQAGSQGFPAVPAESSLLPWGLSGSFLISPSLLTILPQRSSGLLI